MMTPEQKQKLRRFAAASSKRVHDEAQQIILRRNTIMRLQGGEQSRELEAQIDKLTHDSRRAVLKAVGDIPVPRNLTYDYDQQVWIV